MRRRRSSTRNTTTTNAGWCPHADFITLLFAFFVVMYSLSSVNEGKYRVLSDSLVQAFRKRQCERERRTDRAAQGQRRAFAADHPAGAPAVDPVVEQRRQQAAAHAQRGRRDPPRALAADGSGQVKVTEGAFGVSVEINASLLFAPGEAALGSNAVSALQAVARVLAPAEFPDHGRGPHRQRADQHLPLSVELGSSAVRASTGGAALHRQRRHPGAPDRCRLLPTSARSRTTRDREIRQPSRHHPDRGRAWPTPKAMPPHHPADDPIRSILPEAPQG